MVQGVVSDGGTDGNVRTYSRYEFGLQAYYRFDEGSGRIAVDVARDPSSGDEDEEEERKEDSEKDSIPTRFDALPAEQSSTPIHSVSGTHETLSGKPSPCSHEVNVWTESSAVSTDNRRGMR